MNVQDLPQDIVLQVFSFLSPTDLVGGVRKTCKQWNNLSYDRTLWKHVSLYKCGLHNKFSSLSFVEFLRGICKCIQSLDLERTNFNSEGYLHQDILCSELKNLYLFGCEISTDCLLALLKKYNNIVALSLSLNIKSSSRFSAVVEQISEMKNLKKLKIHNCCIVDGDTVAKLCMYRLFTTHKNLKSLSLVHCQFPVDLYTEVIQNNPYLKEINLHICGNVQTNAFRGNTGLKQLQKLDLAGTKCDDYVLTSVADKTSHLEIISINNCGPGITDFGITYLAERCSHITTFIISRTRFDKTNVTDACIEAVARMCPLLRNLVVNYCSSIGDSGVIALSHGCKYLEEFEIAGCARLTDSAVLSLIKNCQGLRKLNLSECAQITNLSVNTAVTNLKYLRYLNLENCLLLCGLKFKTIDTIKNTDTHPTEIDNSKIHNNKIFSDDQNCIKENNETGALSEDGTRKTERTEVLQTSERSPQTNLDTVVVHENISEEHLTNSADIHSHVFSFFLGRCAKISVRCLKQVSCFCPDIRELTLQECSELTDSAVELLVRSCKYLEKLNLSGPSSGEATELTDSTLHSIAIWSQRLKHLVMYNNPNITVHGIFDVAVKCPIIILISISMGDNSRISLPGLNITFSTMESKLVKLDTVGAKQVDIYMYSNKGVEHRKI